MFETLFSYPNVLARHREGPSADAREGYLIHCANQGAARATLLCNARELLVIAQRIDVTTGKKVTQRDIEMAGECWERYQRRRHRSHKIRGSRERFIGTAKAWLQFLELFEEPETLISTFAPLIADFTAYMRDERGLSSITIRNRCWFVEAFLNALECQHRSFASVAIEDVDAFQALRGKQGWGRVTMATSAKALRAFFRHAEIRGWCSQGIAACIDAPRLFRYEVLPAGPNREEVRRLIDSASGSRPQDIRDYAILLLLAIYGLRSGEVAKLRLGDLDWTKELVSIVRPKQGRTQVYPFVVEAGEAILRYLQQARPKCACAELFVTVRAPFRPLSPSSLYSMVSKRLRALGIQAPHIGPHCLRHAGATHLVAQGFSLKEIGDHLGHRSANATRIYAKVDLPGLRQVADFDLEGLLP